jgi:hypothetical protein
MCVGIGNITIESFSWNLFIEEPAIEGSYVRDIGIGEKHRSFSTFSGEVKNMTFPPPCWGYLLQ